MANQHELLVSATDAGALALMLGDRRRSHSLEAAAAEALVDLLSEARFLWQGRRNYVALDPSRGPAHVLLLRRRVRTERDFDYFL